jgi:NADPH:quinone reductase-like Zn-dependent oxidoreductase
VKRGCDLLIYRVKTRSHLLNTSQQDFNMTLPHTMTLIEITEPGGPEVLKPRQEPVPAAGTGEVLIRVHAAGVSRPDVIQRAGKYPMKPGMSPIPGLEVAGEVVAIGAGISELIVGDKVCALTNGGGYAQYCVAPARLTPTLECAPL